MRETPQKVAMEFSSFLFYFSSIGLLFQLSSANVSFTEAKIGAEVAPTDKSISLIEQIPSFNSFVRTFNKSYPTVIDKLAHMKYYLVRALQTFQSVIRYKKHDSTSYLKINEMSDWSPAEVKQLYMSSDTYEEGMRAASERADIDEDDDGDSHIEEPQVHQRVKRNITSTMKRMFLGKEKEDEVYIDHRKSGCLFEPRAQRGYGACSIFAAIALYEWLNCKKNGNLLAFSEQYVIDCGHRVGIKISEGSCPVRVSKFVGDCGLDFRENYPYIARQGDCPYDDSTPCGESNGYLHVIDARLKVIKVKEMAKHLKKGPLIATIGINNNFLSYGGGVDDNVGWIRNNRHTMLLIGHGREKGREYWLFKNSYSLRFGEGGYYKLSKDVDCFVDGEVLAARSLYSN